MVREEFKPKHYKLSALPVEPIPNAILYILDGALNKVRTYITTKTGEPIPLLDLNSGGSGAGITSLTSVGGTVNITSVGTVRNIEIESSLLALINSALQSGDAVSSLMNDAGYITLADIPTFAPSNYDLDDFNNASADPFARISDLSVGGATNLGYTASPTNGIVTSDTGNDATIPLADATNAGLLSPAEKAEIATAVQPSDLGAVATSNDYGDLDNIPSTFTPSSHTHVEADITDLDKYTQAQVDTLIATKQGKWIVVSSNQTAVNDQQYSSVANATYTDPTGVEGKGYNVKVVNGTATIGGVGYAEGRIITRTYHSGSWRTKAYVDETIVGSATVTALNGKAVLGDQRTVVPVAGEYVNVTLASVNGVVVSSSFLYYVGLTFLRDCVADSVQIVSGASSGNGDLKFGVYNSDSNQKPGNKAAECTISVSGTNTVQTGVFSTPVAITKGTHWFTFALGTNGNLVTTYGVNSPTTGNFLENRGGVGDNISRNGSYGVVNNPNNNLPSTVSTIVNAGVIMPKFALLISSVS